MSKSCDKGFNGNCCCNCKNQRILTCHPWNKNYGRGSIDQVCGFACILDIDDNNSKMALFLDRQHGSCEMYDEDD